MIKCNFEFLDYYKSTNKSTIIIKPINDTITYEYKIHSHLGHGTIGNVYLLEYLDKKDHVIKISKKDCEDELFYELNMFKDNLKKNNENEKIFPIFYGNFEKSKKFAIIYNYLGQYNFDDFKIKHYNLLSFKNNIIIIKQIINQLISFDNIIHCDLKSSNIIINKKDNRLSATLIDLGLSSLVIPDKIVLSTNYITSPESLLTIDEYQKCLVNDEDLSMKKHDYFGLFTFILNLFSKENYWYILNMHLTKNKKINPDFLLNQKSALIYVYIWYKFNDSNSNNESLKKIILEIEKKYPHLLTMEFLNFDSYFKLHILPNLNLNLIDEDKTTELFNLLSLLIKFDPIDRPTLEILLEHPLLN